MSRDDHGPIPPDERRSDGLLRHAFESAPVGMAVLDPRGRFLRVNTALCDQLGHSAEELLARTLADLVHPDDRDEGEGGAACRERRLVCGDGHVVWARISASAIAGPDGSPRYTIAQIEDVTEHRQAEERLRRSEARFRALIERSQDLIVLVDEAGHNFFVSPAGEEILGWTAEEQREFDFRDLVHPDDRQVAGACYEAMMRDPDAPIRATLRFRRKDGGYRALDSISRNLLADPAVRAIVVNARDVTEQIRLVEQLAEAQKLEGVGRLAGGIAHDFNNLLCVILSSAEVLAQELRAGDADPGDVEAIRKAAERARDLTGQLLAVARRQVIAPHPLDVNAVVRDAERLLRRIVGEDVDLDVRLAPDLPAVIADPTQLQQVLMNLAANARDAMPSGGKLTVETAAVSLDERYAEEHAGVVPGRYVMLAVSDSGVGMTPEARAHVFEPFFTTKAQGKGTGLGLATVYGIVKQAGGHVWVYSEPGVGTTFKCYLPRAIASASSAAAGSPRRAERAPVRGTETVLVVEDDDAVRALAIRALEGAGYRVLASRGGRAALDAARAAPGLALLLTDVVMPELNGRQLADEVLRIAPGARVLFMSGYTHNAIVHHGVLDEGIEFLAKPFTPSSLVARVREVLDTR